MGLCASAPGNADERQTSKVIQKRLKEATELEKKVVKLLLLGTGESGKSTIFKQMQILYQDGFSEQDRKTYRHVVRRNIVEGLQTLIDGAVYNKFGWVNQESEKAAAFIKTIDFLAADFWVDEITRNVQILWRKEPAIMKAFDLRYKYHIPESVEYLLDEIVRIGAANFNPTPDDILRARLRTSGIVEKVFKIADVDFKFIDVGGQRNERRKWIHCFDNVTAVIFITAISEYDQVLFEDEKVNRLIESINVFESICNSKYFKDTPMILFLNKVDIFRKKIDATPLTVCFPDYAGANNFDATTTFIKDQFFAVNQQRKDIFAHLTCATDTHNVERVFDNCKQIILKNLLNSLGLQ